MKLLVLAAGTTTTASPTASYAQTATIPEHATAPQQATAPLAPNRYAGPATEPLTKVARDTKARARLQPGREEFKQVNQFGAPLLRSWFNRTNPGRGRIVRLSKKLVSGEPERLRNGSTGFGIMRGRLPRDKELSLSFTPRRRLLLDKARTLVGVEDREVLLRNLRGASAREDTGITGNGVFIGIVDSGADMTHPDLRSVNGQTRVAWHLDFSDGPHGFYPSIETALGCAPARGARCGVLGRTEIQTLIDGDSLMTPAGHPVTLPTDNLGHGTHVASLAASTGASESGMFTGIAPGADLVIVRAASNEATITDPDILLASRFVFERADDAERPAVVNLSLGGDFGPHDGSSLLSQALVELTEEKPGRAIVVSAGNSGALIDKKHGEGQGPFGRHTDAFLEPGTKTLVPMFFPESAGPTPGDVLIWIATRPGAHLEVGLESAEGVEFFAPVPAGQVKSISSDWLELVIVNQRREVVAEVLPGADLAEDLFHPNGSAILMSGVFESEQVLNLSLRGEGPVSLWLQAEGGVGPVATEHGVLFDQASAMETVNIPAASSQLIAVGATLNRYSWDGPDGGVHIASGSLSKVDKVGSLGEFSSAGPNQLGVTKPDVVAPGVAVVGAISRNAAPVTSNGDLNFSSAFAGSPLCSGTPDCALAGDKHAVSLGTSMAAPLVSGVVALLLEESPGLTQAEILQLLRAGARQPSDHPGGSERSGAGALDVPQTLKGLAALNAHEPQHSSPHPTETRISLAAPFLRSSGEHPVEGLIHLRSVRGEPLSLNPKEMTLSVERGELVAPLALAAPGLYSFQVVASAGVRGKHVELRLAHKGQLLAQHRVRVGRTYFDRFGSSSALPAESYGCRLPPGGVSRSGWQPSALLLTLLLMFLGHRRRCSARELP